MKVILWQDDIDRAEGRKRMGVAIFPYDESVGIEEEEKMDDYLRNIDCLERVYGESDFAAWSNARLLCKEQGCEIVCEI